MCDALFGMMQSKLESLAAQQGTQQGPSAKGVSTIAWRGTTSVVAAERVKITLANALDLSKQVHSYQPRTVRFTVAAMKPMLCWYSG